MMVLPARYNERAYLGMRMLTFRETVRAVSVLSAPLFLFLRDQLDLKTHAESLPRVSARVVRAKRTASSLVSKAAA